MAVWDEVKVVLLDLEGSGVLLQWPDPRADQDRSPPIAIKLQPWATDVAEELHRRFGSKVELVVGDLDYPSGSRSRPSPSETLLEADPTEMRFELDGPDTVRSGHNLHTGIRVHNLTTRELTFNTNGLVTGQIVDRTTGEVVGGSVGAQRLPLIRFVIGPRGSETIPLFIGTASFEPDVGYAVPPGAWAVTAPLHLDDGRRVRTAALPIIVID